MEGKFQKLYSIVKPQDIPRLEEVLVFAHENLSYIRRRTGESYAQHGFEVATVLAEINIDLNSLRAAILHDLFLHSDAENLLKQAPLTKSEKILARQMHDLRRVFIDSDTQGLNQFINALVQDERLLFLRMAHRLNDIRRLHRFKGNLRKQIAHETLHMYTAIASRLGMHAWGQEMEDTCFKVVHPTIAKKLAIEFEARRPFDEKCLNETEQFLVKKFKQKKIGCHIEKRIKGLYSTYQKMVNKRRGFLELTDRLALRIVLDDYLDCYQALGLVHAFMHPIPGKLKDYIGAPKENGYQSIHTVVYPLIGVNQQPLEIQIRTQAMDEFCRFGPAAHANYKKNKYTLNSASSRVNLLRNIAYLHQDVSNPKQFEKALRSYFNSNYVGIFDSKNNLYHLKKPITAIDFVCHIYPQKFRKLKSVTINGKPAKVDQPLKDGDVVHPEFSPELTFKKTWVKFSLNPVIQKKLNVPAADHDLSD